MYLTSLNEISEVLQRFYRAFRIPVSLYTCGRLQTSYVAIAFIGRAFTKKRELLHWLRKAPLMSRPPSPKAI